MDVKKININQSELSYNIASDIYDVSAHNDGATFESVSALLSAENLSILIPTSVRCGGMSIRFIQSSDNKYVQYRLMANNFSTDEVDWQGVDDEPIYGSNNLVKSGGVSNAVYTDWLLFETYFESGYIDATGLVQSSINASHTDFIEISNKKFSIVSSTASSWNIGYYSAASENSFIEAIKLPNQTDENARFIVPSVNGAKYVRITVRNNGHIDSKYPLKESVSSVLIKTSAIDELQNDVNYLNKGIIPRIIKNKKYTAPYSNVNSYVSIRGLFTTTTSNSSRTDYLPIEKDGRLTLNCIFGKNESLCQAFLYDKNKMPICPIKCVDFGLQYDSSVTFYYGNYTKTFAQIIESESSIGDAAYIVVNSWELQNEYTEATITQRSQESCVFESDYEQDKSELQEDIEEIQNVLQEEKVNYDRILSIAELPTIKDFDAFVFIGQSNMMGAPAKLPLDGESCAYSFEYKYKNRLIGNSVGEFVTSHHPAGEWYYKDPSTAYGSTYLNHQTGKSTLTNYASNCHFIAAMSNAANEGINTQVNNFSTYSEDTARNAASLAPCFAREYATYGRPCIFSQMAKGSVRIEYYFNQTMQARFEEILTDYNNKHDTSYTGNFSGMSNNGEAVTAFLNKVSAMFDDFATIFGSSYSVNSKSVVMLQGESNHGDNEIEYKLKLQVLWEYLQTLGFERMFICRVDYFGSQDIINIMKAQEDFCNETDNVFMVTRSYSYMKYNPTTWPDWFVKTPSEKYEYCRDNFYGYSNNHINENGHNLAAKKVAYNIYRVIHKGLQPEIEDELITNLIIA